MKFNFRQLLPHLIAIGIFLLVSVIFCKPALDSEIGLKQQDVLGWKAMSAQSMSYKAEHGHYPLWVTSMFCGMPAYQIAIEGSFSPLYYVDRTIQLWLPQPISFFFLACICFYFLCMCLGLRTFAAILGSLAFAYCSYSPIIIAVGHITKMLALAYCPAVIGAVILIFKKRYFAGFSLLALFTSLQIAQGHQQISYYLLIVLGIMTLSYIIQGIREKEIMHLGKSLGLMIIAAVLGAAVSAITLLSVNDYSKYSKRGGQLQMSESKNDKDKVVNGKTTGLSKDYAFMWSYGKKELWSLMIPSAQGYGFHQASRDNENYSFPSLDEKSKTAGYWEENFNGSQFNSGFFSQKLYWGDQPNTDGPVYLGAIICFLFIIGMFYLDNKNKWWIFSATVIAALLALGNNLPSLNYWIFDHVPFYNKFRAPSMTLTIIQMLAPVMAVLVLDKILSEKNEDSWVRLKKGMIATAVILGLALATYFTFDYSNENTKRTKAFNEFKTYDDSSPEFNAQYASLNASNPSKKDNELYEQLVTSFYPKNAAPGMTDANEIKSKARGLVFALREDRKAYFMQDSLKAIFFMLLAAFLIFLYVRKRFINAIIFASGLTLLTAIELLSFGSNYLNNYNYEVKNEDEVTKTAADIEILKDTSKNYRVLNVSRSGDYDIRTSFFHNSIAGYHPAKLGIYDDLNNYQISKRNPAVLDMLNAKYLFQEAQNENSPAMYQIRPTALGNAWLVKGITWVKGPVAEMKALDLFNVADTAIVDESFKTMAGNAGEPDSLDYIKLRVFDNDSIQYESNTKSPRFAVFSEIYYKDWHAYIDAKPTPYFKANYVLRSMLIPAGQHVISFRFEPEIFFTGKKISTISSWIIFLTLLTYLIYAVRKAKTKKQY